MLETLLFNKELDYDRTLLREKFSMNSFFEKNFYPISLYYLGMLTVKDEYTMTLPNQTMQIIFTEYFNLIYKLNIEDNYKQYFVQFKKDLRIVTLFDAYFNIYIKRLPAQCFDKANENFFRTTFYELCSRYLSVSFVLKIETNYPSGRSDLEILGKYHTEYKNLHWLIEFKHYPKSDPKVKQLLALTKAYSEDINQIEAYEKDILVLFPEYKIKKTIIYIIGAEQYKCFDI